MATHVALLRGINLGGRNKVAMADLRAVVASLGHTDVATYIQSGNVVFTAAPGATDLGRALEMSIAAALDMRVPVVVLSRPELAGAFAANPYPDVTNPRALHAIFLPAAPAPGCAAALAAEQQRSAQRGDRDEVTLLGRTAYLHTPDGFGRSDLAIRLLARAASPVSGGTARNWATVSKLLAMCEA